MFGFVSVLNSADSPEAICSRRLCLAVGAAAAVAPNVPELPAPWNLYLLPAPVEAMLKAIHSMSTAGEGASGRETYFASIDKGTNAGLKPGMWLHGRYNVLVESVSADESLVRYVGNSNPPFRTNAPPMVGDRFWTRYRR